jgi:hypothetical protein
MRDKDVPQDDSVYEGHQRACYALGEDGRYHVVPSRGWEAETIVNQLAVNELRDALEKTRQRVLAGETSPLAYHMERCQMTVPMLAANTGIWSWRVRRHLRAQVFARLVPELLQRYAEALRMSVEDLRSIPAAPLAVPNSELDGDSVRDKTSGAID